MGVTVDMGCRYQSCKAIDWRVFFNHRAFQEFIKFLSSGDSIFSAQILQ